MYLKNCIAKAIQVPKLRGISVCRISGGISVCRHLSTNPIELPEIDFQVPDYEGPSYSWTKDIRQKLLNPALVPYYKNPLLIQRGYMQWLFDNNNRRYLDLFGGIVTVSVGHCHPKVCRAAEEQMKLLWHTTNIYYHPKIHEYAFKLTQKLPPNLNVVYFVNSGSEANDLAITMARLYTGAYDIISLKNSYHGASPLTMNLSGLGNWKYGNVCNSGGVYHAMNPDPYQGAWGGHRDSPIQSCRKDESEIKDGICSSSYKYIRELKDVIQYSVAGSKPAAFFAESIQGVGGTVQFPQGYLKMAFDLIRQNGGLCVSDEVQAGFGRTGDHFWGFEAHGVVPDIVSLAKGIGNGFPLAAVVTSKEVAKTLEGALHFNTYGGNPIASAVGMAVLDAMEEDKTQERCKELGTYFLKELGKLGDEFEIIGDVRGKGLMIGVEMVNDAESRNPLKTETLLNIWEDCKDMGVLLGKGGRFGNVFRIKPPMCITKEDVDFSIKVLGKAIEMNS